MRPDIPQPLADVCMKALSRDVDARYATAEEMSDALEKAARSLECVGSVREVSECLESVMGIDLTQQRDAVRAWLARSEPSKGTPRSRPQLGSMVTKVEGGSSPSSASSPSSSSGPSSQVSSFSSAILQVTPSHMPPAHSSAPPAVMPQGRRMAGRRRAGRVRGRRAGGRVGLPHARETPDRRRVRRDADAVGGRTRADRRPRTVRRGVTGRAGRATPFGRHRRLRRHRRSGASGPPPGRPPRDTTPTPTRHRHRSRRPAACSRPR